MNVARIATYRLQFRNGMTFARAIEIIPYLRRLGISHLYASPVFAATRGSTHGYDVIDYNRFDPAIGGEAGFERLAAAVRNAGMGLILDIVPNHMAASLENRWWRSVVKLGANSPFASHFDIDWQRRLTLPILGQDFAEVLANGEFSLVVDREHSDLALSFQDHRLPLQPHSWSAIAERLGDMAPALAHPNAAAETGLDAALADLSRDRAFLDRLHAAQPWELRPWKEARHNISYRRFFEVSSLVGVRVEQDNVFDDVHRLVLAAIRSGAIDGVRVDHVDGLAFPTAYLHKLRRAVGPGIWIMVEKILAEGERLPEEWDGIGTTGYEFIASASNLLVDRPDVEEMRRLHDAFTGNCTGAADALHQARHLILTRNFKGELNRLVAMAHDLAQRCDGPDKQRIRDAICGIILGFDVYRTYGETGTLSAQDRKAVARAAGAALRRDPDQAEAIDFIVGLLQGTDAVEPADATAFRSRFQQLTGPVMAKSVEDTFFYRRNALIALNEVGCSPEPALQGIAGFHEAMRRAAGNPESLVTTATHDTKRGEDSRARLLALAERPAEWAQAVRCWHEKHDRLRSGASEPEASVEWLLYQALAGTLPSRADPDPAWRTDLAARFSSYLEKALREAKLRTDWLEIDTAYEEAVLHFASQLLDPDRSDFTDVLARKLRSITLAGARNGLAQCLAKLTVPGIPDIYQGSEQNDLSLVDPDNRRPVDFDALAHGLEFARPADLDSALLDGRLKQWMIAAALACRRDDPLLFLRGAYIPLALQGECADYHPAFLREYGANAAIVVLQRRSLHRPRAPSDADCIELPERIEGRRFRNVLFPGTFTARRHLPLPLLLTDMPVGLAVSAG